MNTRILGNEIIIYIDTVASLDTRPSDDTNYRAVACLVTNGLQGSGDDIDLTSKCSGYFKESDTGDVGFTMSGNGQAIGDPEITQANYQELMELFITRTKFWAKTANPSNGVLREAVVRISSYNETFDRNTPFTFDATFTVSGELYVIALT